MTRRSFVGFALSAASLRAVEGERILVVTADGEDFLWAAAGSLALDRLDGRPVTVAQFGNDEKDSAGLPTHETRRANRGDTRAAAEILGIEDFVFFDHKSGEFGYLSQAEMRDQLVALIRRLRPATVYLPDPYARYVSDWDVRFAGRAAEDALAAAAWPSTGAHLARMGFEPFAPREILYYTVGGPPSPGPLAYGASAVRDIDMALTAKKMALSMLRTRNRAHVHAARLRLAAAGRSDPWAGQPEDKAAGAWAVAAVEDLARACAEPGGARFAERFVQRVDGVERAIGRLLASGGRR